jgi:ribonuclease G
VRDLFTDDIYKFIIDSETEFERILEFVETFQPKLKKSVELYTAAEPIFDRYGVEVEITRALGQKVWLKSGGYIIIEQTEALTAIDVNTGRFVGRRNVEDTILKTNLEAVKEIVYQLRLRNIGGIIILDFIDMERHVNRAKVFNTLKEALRADRAKTTITKISELGLVEMTRKRTREDISRSLTDPCPYCEGKGYLKSTLTICYEIFREIRREAPNFKGKQIVVYVHASVADVLYDEERRSIEELEERFKKRIYIKAIDTYHLEQFDILEK